MQAGQFAINHVLERLASRGWKVKLYTTAVHGARWCAVAKKPGLDIGTFGLYGYGNNSRVAVKMLAVNIRKHLEDHGYAKDHHAHRTTRAIK